MLFRSVQNVYKPENTTRVSRFTLNFISAVAILSKSFFFGIQQFCLNSNRFEFRLLIALELDSY